MEHPSHKTHVVDITTAGRMLLSARKMLTEIKVGKKLNKNTWGVKSTRPR